MFTNLGYTSLSGYVVRLHAVRKSRRSIMKVKNQFGTGEKACKCGSWLDHWKKFSGQVVPTYCTVIGCYNTDLVGAHVQKDNSSDRASYIIPLCTTHNKTDGAFETSDSYNLVSANVSATCG